MVVVDVVDVDVDVVVVGCASGLTVPQPDSSTTAVSTNPMDLFIVPPEFDWAPDPTQPCCLSVQQAGVFIRALINRSRPFQDAQECIRDTGTFGPLQISRRSAGAGQRHSVGDRLVSLRLVAHPRELVAGPSASC